MLLVKKVQGPPVAGVGERIVYRAVEFNQANPSAAELDEVKWIIECDGQTVAEATGLSADFTPPATLLGKAVIAMAYRNSPSRTVSATTVIQQAAEMIQQIALNVLACERLVKVLSVNIGSEGLWQQKLLDATNATEAA